MAPPFQAADLRQFQTTGLSGEVAREGPLRAFPWILNSSGQANVIGFAYTKVADGEAQVGGDISAGAEFVGIMIRPKEHALVGVGASALTPTNSLADAVVAQMCDMGILYVQLDDTSVQAVAGAVGTALFFDDTTGAVAAGTAGAGESVIPNARIVIEDVADDGLAIVSLTN